MTRIIRRATPLDAGAAGNILWYFQNSTDWMPKLHSGAEILSFCGLMIDEGIVRVVDRGQGVEGFIAQRGAEVLALYLAQGARGQGLGSALIREAQIRSPELTLWTFQRNTGAQRFYLRHGFAEVDRSDGGRNDEHLPDIRYRWERMA